MFNESPRKLWRKINAFRSILNRSWLNYSRSMISIKNVWITNTLWRIYRKVFWWSLKHIITPPQFKKLLVSFVLLSLFDIDRHFVKMAWAVLSTKLASPSILHRWPRDRSENEYKASYQVVKVKNFKTGCWTNKSDFTNGFRFSIPLSSWLW